jgi:hypothetical protein
MSQNQQTSMGRQDNRKNRKKWETKFQATWTASETLVPKLDFKTSTLYKMCSYKKLMKKKNKTGILPDQTARGAISERIRFKANVYRYITLRHRDPRLRISIEARIELIFSVNER